MDIHTPEGPTHSFKDFALHILIVTIGILIALALEGIRESWREHRAVVEARDAFDRELRSDIGNLDEDRANVREVAATLDAIIAQMPGLAQTPAELQKRVNEVQPAFYYFSTNAWEATLSNGTLSHMDSEQLKRYVNAYLSIKNYQQASQQVIPVYQGLISYIPSHHSYSPGEEAEAEQQLRRLRIGLRTMQHLGNECSSDITKALSSTK